MGKVKYRNILFFAIITAVSCSSGPKSTDSAEELETVISKPGQNTEAVFDSASISQEVYESTKVDVQVFIEELNGIIRAKNYNAWKAALSEEFFNEISSPEYLQRISEMDAMKTRKIILRTTRDYFINVVVPARANSRVDDIEFISLNRVKAFTLYTNRENITQRLRLYDLERSGDSWKIIN